MTIELSRSRCHESEEEALEIPRPQAYGHALNLQTEKECHSEVVKGVSWGPGNESEVTRGNAFITMSVNSVLPLSLASFLILVPLKLALPDTPGFSLHFPSRCLSTCQSSTTDCRTVGLRDNNNCQRSNVSSRPGDFEPTNDIRE